MKNQEIAQIFDEIADRLEIKGENPFRIRAYRRAAQNVVSLTRNIEDLSHEELREIPGVGQDLAAKIEEYLKTGKVQALEELKKGLPEGLLTLLSVPTLGPKTAKLLHERFKIKNLDELEKLAQEHKLAGTPGIQKKTEENILKGIALVKRGTDRHPLGIVLPLAENIVDQLRKKAPVDKISVAGSLRRWKETIGDIDILATSRDPDRVMEVFVHLPLVSEVLAHGPTKSSIRTREGIQADVRVVEDKSYGAALLYFTGNKAHNIRLRELAIRKGLKVNEYGIFREKDDKWMGGRTEEEMYKILGLPYIPPELRRDQGEIEAALEGKLPKLITLDDIKGDLHVHSDWSDGSFSFEELAEAAKARGYSYFALTDHTKGLGIARGLNEERFLDQKKKIAAVNKKLKGFRILHGAEMDIRSNGSMDLPDELLRQLDIVVASIHSGFRQSEAQITSRIISAMKNPYVSIIGHLSGRLLGTRDAYAFDFDEILKAAKDTGTALEINAQPSRLDLNDAHIRRAKERGVAMVISTDTHVLDNFDFMPYGVAMARRGWLEKKDVLNTLNADALLKKTKPLSIKKER